MELALARSNMVEQQVRPWDVLDMRVLDLMEEIPRELFVPEGRSGLAYADVEIPLGHGESMLAPKVVGRLLQALAPVRHEVALEIGTGSGYLSACLGRLAAHVDSVERIDAFRLAARERLERLDITNVHLRTGQVTRDWTPPRQRYNVIACTASLPDYDPFLEPYLTVGGRLFVVVGDPPIMQARLITRYGEQHFRTEVLFETQLKPMVGFERPPSFIF